MRVYKSSETLTTIQSIIHKNESGIYLRFGDGDYMLAENRNDKIQIADNNLSIEMQEAIGINGKNVLKSIPLYCEKYGMKDDDIIIKLTGRYRILSPQFFNDVIENNWCRSVKIYLKPRSKDKKTGKWILKSLRGIDIL